MNDLVGLVLTKEKIFSMFLMFSGVMSPRDPISKQVRSQMNPLSKISGQGLYISEPHDHELSGCFFQMKLSTQPGE